MDFTVVTTEILTVSLALLLLITDLIIPEKESRRGIGYFAVLGLAGILAFTFTQYGQQVAFYRGMFVLDSFAVFLKQLFLSAVLFTILFSFDYVDRLPRFRGEFYCILVLAAVGMMVMASANDFLTLFVGMELMTVSFFILVGFMLGDGRSSEAGIKYLIIGASSTAVLLYGVSLVYGTTGSIVFADILRKAVFSPAALVGMALVFVGFAFKIAAVPFHMWSPDIYEGAPVPVTALLAMASKAAGFSVLVRAAVEAFSGQVFNWALVAAALSLISILLGNLVAIPQANIKRMMAYSSIAQAGYLLAGLAAATESGVKGILFYAMLYVFANVGVFAVMTAVRLDQESDDMRSYAGLSQRSPLLAAVMTVSLLSMAGIPPLAGFVGKFYLFSAAVESGLVWLAFAGFVMSMVSVYYYLMVVKVMYLLPPVDSGRPEYSHSLAWAAIVSMALTVFFGVYPEPLAELANLAAKSLF